MESKSIDEMMEVRRTLHSIVDDLQGKYSDIDALLGYDPNSGHSLELSSYGLRTSRGFPEIVSTLFMEFMIKREEYWFLVDQRYYFGSPGASDNKAENMAKDFAARFGFTHASLGANLDTAQSSTPFATLEDIKGTVIKNVESYIGYLRGQHDRGA